MYVENEAPRLSRDAFDHVITCPCNYKELRQALEAVEWSASGRTESQAVNGERGIARKRTDFRVNGVSGGDYGRTMGGIL